MTQAVEGLQLSLEDAKRSLTDFKGNAIEFEAQKDGSLISKEVESDNYTYTYSLVPQTQIVTVSVAKNPKKKAEAKKSEPQTQTTSKKSY